MPSYSRPFVNQEVDLELEAPSRYPISVELVVDGKVLLKSPKIEPGLPLHWHTDVSL